MFYFISKTISYFLTPAGWLLGTLAAAWLWPGRCRLLVGTSLLLFWMLGNNYLIYYQLARHWEVGIRQPLPKRSPANLAPTVAVVLTGGTMNTRLRVVPDRPLLGSQADRLGQALFLYKTGQVQKILISGGESTLPFYGEAAVPEGQAALAFLKLAGVPISDLLWETRSRNTRENARFSAQLLRQHYQTDRCVLVTSAFHMRRAVGCFGREGIEATPFAAAYLQETGNVVPADLLVPHEQTFADAMHLLKEMIGYVTYVVMGYV